MFETFSDRSVTHRPRPSFTSETACASSPTSCQRHLSTTRVKVPFGIAPGRQVVPQRDQPRNLTFRLREFEQMEMEFFCVPAPTTTGSKVGRNRASAGTPTWTVRRRCGCVITTSSRTTGRPPPDIEYLFPFGWGELKHEPHRFDLRPHQQGGIRNRRQVGTAAIHPASSWLPKMP